MAKTETATERSITVADLREVVDAAALQVVGRLRDSKDWPVGLASGVLAT